MCIRERYRVPSMFMGLYIWLDFQQQEKSRILSVRCLCLLVLPLPLMLLSLIHILDYAVIMGILEMRKGSDNAAHYERTDF